MGCYFSCVGFSIQAQKDSKIGIHTKGCVDNFMRFQRKDGSIPYAIMGKHAAAPDPESIREPDSERNQSKPLQAQFTTLALRQNAEV